jgi:hypothetical protein
MRQACYRITPSSRQGPVYLQEPAPRLAGLRQAHSLWRPWALSGAWLISRFASFVCDICCGSTHTVTSKASCNSMTFYTPYMKSAASLGLHACSCLLLYCTMWSRLYYSTSSTNTPTLHQNKHVIPDHIVPTESNGQRLTYYRSSTPHQWWAPPVLFPSCHRHSQTQIHQIKYSISVSMSKSPNSPSSLFF